jgi:hypothetical protein
MFGAESNAFGKFMVSEPARGIVEIAGTCAGCQVEVTVERGLYHAR